MIKNKLQSSKGESLVEILTAILIITITVAFLSSAIVTASRINTAISKTQLGLKYSDNKTSVTIKAKTTSDPNGDTILDPSSKVSLYQSEIKYYAGENQYNSDYYYYYKSSGNK